MIFVSDIDDSKIHRACVRAHYFLAVLEWEEIRRLSPFTHIDDTVRDYILSNNKTLSGYIHSTIEAGSKSRETCRIKPWRPWNPWSKAIAMVKGDGNIYLNVRMIKTRSLHDYVNTIVHEVMHLLGFGHGDNYYTEDKARSVPYAIGSLAEKWSIIQDRETTHVID